jgi:hypothetical protein
LNRKVQLQIEFAKIDPLLFSTNIDFKAFSYKEAQPLVNEFIELIQKYQFLNNVNFLDYLRQRNIAKEFFYFGEQAYKDKNPTIAAWYYQKALVLNPFIMGDIKASFLDEKNFEQAAAFLKYFKDFNPDSMNGNFYPYMDFYDKTLVYLFQNDRLDEFYVLAEAIFRQQPNFSWFVFRDIVATSKTPEEKERLLKVHEHFKDLSTWADFWPLKD